MTPDAVEALAAAICKGLGIPITSGKAEPFFANAPFIAAAIAAAGYRIVREEEGLRKAAQVVVLAAKKHTPEIAALNAALAAAPPPALDAEGTHCPTCGAAR